MNDATAALRAPWQPHRHARQPRRFAQSSCWAALWLCACGLSVPASHAQDKIDYNDHILPLVEANCAKCHNPDKKKADLDLTSYQSALKGSGSGTIVLSGNPDGSKLWKALTHAEEPFMPPNRPKLGEKDLDVFRKWIGDGLLESAGGKAVAIANSGIDLALKPETIDKPTGPPPMPQDLPIEPVVHTARMNAITGLGASPWAPLVAVAGEKQILLFHTGSLQLLGILPFDEGQPVGLKFSHNGKLLLACGGRGAKSGRVVLWDVVSGEHLLTLGEEYDTVLAADIRPDQSQVALGGPSRLVKILSTSTGQVLHKIKKHTEWVTAVAFSPNGQMLATADRNGGISVWDPDAGQELFTLAGHKSAVTALSWRPDSKLLASSSEDGTIKLWELQEGKQVKSWAAHRSGTLCVSYARDGRLVSCGRDNTVILWDAKGSKVRQFDCSGDLPLRVAFDDDGGRIFATDFQGRVTAWSAADAKRVAMLDANPPLLADQIAAARQQLQEIQSRLNGTPADAASAAKTAKARPGSPQPQATSLQAELAAANAKLERLQAAEVLSSIYRLRETITTEKREHDQLTASLAAHKAQPAPSRDAEAKADSSELLLDKPIARQLAFELKAAQSRVDRLLSQYRAALAGAQVSPRNRSS